MKLFSSQFWKYMISVFPNPGCTELDMFFKIHIPSPRCVLLNQNCEGRSPDFFHNSPQQLGRARSGKQRATGLQDGACTGGAPTALARERLAKCGRTWGFSAPATRAVPPLTTSLWPRASRRGDLGLLPAFPLLIPGLHRRTLRPGPQPTAYDQMLQIRQVVQVEGWFYIFLYTYIF